MIFQNLTEYYPEESRKRPSAPRSARTPGFVKALRGFPVLAAEADLDPVVCMDLLDEWIAGWNLGDVFKIREYCASNGHDWGFWDVTRPARRTGVEAYELLRRDCNLCSLVQVKSRSFMQTSLGDVARFSELKTKATNGGSRGSKKRKKESSGRRDARERVR